MRKLGLLLIILVLTSCVTRTTRTYIHTPPNSPHGHLIDEKTETVWFWQK